MRIRSLIPALLFSGLLSGCAATGPDTTTYAGAVEAAQQKQAEARELGHAWNTFEPLMRQAEAANDAGDEEEAVRLANEARLHAELAIEQAGSEASAWRERASF